MEKSSERARSFLIKNVRNTFAILFERCRGYDFSSCLHKTSSLDNYPYEKTDRKILLEAFQQLELPSDAAFLDIGCGKGYVLLHAHRYGFQQVAGIEKNSTLTAIARRNLRRARIPATIYEQDVLDFQHFDSYSVFYMFNPFSEAVMLKIVERFAASVKKVPRKIYILYANPTCHHLLASLSVSFRTVNGRIAGYDSCIAIYTL